MQRRLSARALATAGWMALGAASAAAAETPTPAPDAATAAAPETTEPYQDSAVAATVLSAARLAALQITETRDVLQIVPNALGSNSIGLGSANTYFIRGLGNQETLPTSSPAVATFVDGVYLPRQNDNNFLFFDLDRIDVLRGPQGTLFGRNAAGGVVDVKLAEPSHDLHGYLEGGYGTYRRSYLRGSIDLPFSPNFALKLSGYYQNDHGTVRNTTTNQRNNDDAAAGIRGAFRWDIADRLTWNASVAYLRGDGENILNFTCDPRNAANCNGRFASTGVLRSYPANAPTPFATLGVTGRKAGFGLQNRTDTLLATSVIAWRTDAIGVTLTTGVTDLKQKYALDLADGRALPTTATPVPAAAGYPLGGYTLLNDGRNHSFSQDVRVDGTLFGGVVDYLVGGNYFDETSFTDAADVATLTNGVAPAGVLLADRLLHNTTSATAGFAQLGVHPLAALTLTAGVRYTDEKRTLALSDNRPACQLSPLPAGCLNTANLTALGIPATQTSKLWTPSFTASYRLTDILFFASASRGYQSGGWNGRGLTPSTVLPYDPARVWNYEGGVKSELFGHRLRANLTGFWTEAKGLQAQSEQVGPAGVPAFTTQNVDYSDRGVELELTAVPIDRLTLFANFGYQNARYKVPGTLGTGAYGVKTVAQQQLDCRAELAAGKVALGPTGTNAVDCAAGIVNAAGGIARPVRTPDFSVAAGATYDYPIPAAGIILEPSVNVSYRSTYEAGTSNATLYAGGRIAGGSRVNGYALVGAALALKTDDNNWVLSVECTNCTDKAYTQSSVFNFSYLAPPRTVLLRAKRTF